MFDWKALIDEAAAQGASDIHLTVGLPPVLRVEGTLRNDGAEPLTQAEITAAAGSLANEKQMAELDTLGETDFAVTFRDALRIRCNIYRQQGHTAMALRLLPLRVPTVEDLKLPAIVAAQTEKSGGLVLVTGPTGSGKSSTLAALLDRINKTQRRHIITLESPIEYIHQPDQCVINQREVGTDTGSFSAGLRAALRQDPDVILVGEMRDLETISTALAAAETGHLVFATLHTRDAVSTVDRIIDAFPAAQQTQARTQLAGVLECIIGQALLPAIGGGRCAAFEILLGTPAVRSMIRQNKSFQLASAMQTGRKLGMRLLDDALAELVRSGEVSAQAAATAANDPAAFRRQGAAPRAGE